MSNFYGKRFLSSLLGALSVLSSPVASAGKNELGRGDLGEGVHSSSRDKNNGNLGELKSNREVKSVDGLKKVLKETGGEVVRVSPDGKGGFVAFVKTPTGKVVTVAIVGVSLIAIITFLVVLYRRKSNVGSKENVDDDDDGKNKSLINDEELGINRNNTIENVDKVENATEKLLTRVFGNDQGRYDSFVNKLLGYFFNDERVRKMFDVCGGNLDKFLESVFMASDFQVCGDGDQWKIKVEGGNALFRYVGLTKVLKSMMFGTSSGALNIFGFYSVVVGYLSREKFFDVPGDGKEASWRDKISVVLFGFWFLVEYKLEFGSSKVTEILKDENNHDTLEGVFAEIRDYVWERLKAAGRDDNGQKLEKAE